MLNHSSIIAAGLLALAASATSLAQDVQADKKMIKAHLSFLADDLLEGRETGSRGYDIAANYVKAQFMQYGLEPKGDNGGFLQQVPLRAARLVQDSTVVELTGPSGTEKLAYLSDYFVSGSLLEDKSEVSAPLVFVGYGIEAERFKHNDYAGADVKGKIVVVLSGKPKSFPTEEGAHFGSSDEKRELAAKYGAVGVITIPTPASEKASPFSKYKDYQYIPVMSWVEKSGVAANQQPAVQNRASLSLPASQKLFAQSGVKLDDIYALAAANKPVPRVDLKLSARLAKQSTRSEVRSSNVVGMIEGSDPKLKHEYVVFSAHLDHLGQVKEKSGDNIYNGAMDNASGVATLIETARLFAQGKVQPKRSILFVAVTGEEKGLLGADYFASNPTVPLKAIVANVNLDMPLLTFDFRNVMAFGAEHSSLKDHVTRALATMKLDLLPDPWPEQGLFTRSDHYMFVRQGVPSIFLATGMGSFQKGEDGAKAWEEFFSKHYHQPSDDLNLPINFDAAARFAQLNYNIALEIANAAEKPAWNKGDFFGDTFSK
ncbi:M28 family peptidase [Pseudoduganella sp. LjRoot289]|uniref:M28 family peptidase n=1 Tax=Pseudoduganella sp. LjRoot289 TaxID=3342314 RepID=UPI003ED07DA3